MNLQEKLNHYLTNRKVEAIEVSNTHLTIVFDDGLELEADVSMSRGAYLDVELKRRVITYESI